jgi:hypothetical protein
VATVGLAYAALDATAAVLAARVHISGLKVATAASRHVGTDEASAQQLAELTGGLERG